jgi:hypothetical protein
LNKKTKQKEVETKSGKRPFAKSDLEAVLKSATKPLKQEQDETKPEET